MISAVVCTYERYDLLEHALSTLKQQTLSADKYFIFVIDNSRDAKRARSYLEKYDKVDNIRYIFTGTSGLSNARNIAAHECQTEFVAYMDDDALANSDWLENLLHAFDKFGVTAGAVGGPVLPIWQSQRPSWLPDELLGYFTVVDWGGALRSTAEHEWLAGANMAFRTQALLQAGAFSIGLGRNGTGGALLSNEELELQSKLRAAGLSVVWAPGAKVRHLVHHERLHQDWLRKRCAWQAVSDFMGSGGAERLSADAYWQRLLGYFNGLPPHLRTIRGLFVEVSDPSNFSKQAHANYNLTMLLLSGYAAVDSSPRSDLNLDAVNS
jgi:glycosyltransferase involved in cell wall biosynthesis